MARDQKQADDDSDVEILDPPPSAPKSSSSTSKHSKWTTNDLPAGAQDDDRWSMVFVPTLLRYQGCRHDPWNCDQVTNLAIIQKVWDQVYGDTLSHKVQSSDSVYAVVGIYNLMVCICTGLTFCRPPNASTTGEVEWRLLR